jgi:arylsulfatase A-like enzyme
LELPNQPYWLFWKRIQYTDTFCFTGRHCARPQAGAKSDDRKVDAGSYCIAMPFKAAGYQTFIIGKWHLSDGKTMPQDKGFDINIGAGKAGSTGTYFAPFNKPNATNPDKLIYGGISLYDCNSPQLW